MNPTNPEPKDTVFLAIQSLLENLAPCDTEVEPPIDDLKEAKQLMELGKFNEAIQQLKRAYMEVCQRNDLEDKFIEMNDEVSAEKALIEVQLCQTKQLMKHRKSKEAEELLKLAFHESLRRRRTDMGIFTLDMALVEVLICQGKYAEAKERESLKNPNVWEAMPDARIPLYKAIIHTMLEENDEAKKNWDQFLTATADKEENSEEAYKKRVGK